MGCLTVWPDWAIYWTLGNILKPLAKINLPKSPRFLSNFCKGVKITIFLVKSFLGNFYRHLAIFSGHTDYTLILLTGGKGKRRKERTDMWVGGWTINKLWYIISLLTAFWVMYEVHLHLYLEVVFLLNEWSSYNWRNWNCQIDIFLQIKIDPFNRPLLLGIYLSHSLRTWALFKGPS